MFDIVDIDFQSNVVFTDQGDILEIESYVDEDETPCLQEEAVALFYITGSYSIYKHYLNEEQRDYLCQAYESINSEV